MKPRRVEKDSPFPEPDEITLSILSGVMFPCYVCVRESMPGHVLCKGCQVLNRPDNWGVFREYRSRLEAQGFAWVDKTNLKGAGQ